MDERWHRIIELFHAALERAPEVRARYLDDACGPDAALRAEVDSLLDAHERADSFLDRPAAVSLGLVSADEDEGPGQGEMLGAYRIDRQIGRGGMGVVYLAEDTRLARRVAIKVLAPALASDQAMRARLRREARTAAALSHPAIATVFAFEEIDGRACLVTEYVPGATLRAELADGPLPFRDVLEIGIQLARGLAAAHAARVVHRDLKPDNVVRARDGAIKILDFGIAHLDGPSDPGAPRLTQAGLVVGTPGYMSPEQIEGGAVDQRSDIFSLGVLLFELATGRHPFDGASPAAIAGTTTAADPPPIGSLAPGVPATLDEVVRRCLKRARADRYLSSLDVAHDLEAIRDGRSPAMPGPVVDAPRTGASTGRRSQIAWWRIHQAVRMVVLAALAFGVWRVHASLRVDWTLAIFLGYVVTGAVNGTFRAHLLFTNIVNPGDLRDEFERARVLIRATDLLVALLLLLAAAVVARSQALLPSILAAVAVAWAVTTFVIEPATYRAAFDRQPQ